MINNKKYNNISKFLKIREICNVKNIFKEISPGTFYRILNDNQYNVGIHTLKKIEDTFELKLKEIKNVIDKKEKETNERQQWMQ